jgi:tRNA U34 5-carboxymethylaminomethyl modifying GTPase MnmE/TrmE
MELVSLHLQTAKGALEEILGIQPSENVLDRIFNRFCIGK